MGFDGQGLVVIGGSQGVGRTLATTFADEGGQSFVTGRDRSRLEDVRKALDGRGATFVHDVTTDGGFRFLAELPDEVAVTSAVYCASHRYVPARLHQAEPTDLLHTIQTDLLGAEAFAQAMLPRLMTQTRSSLVFIGSLSSSVGMKGGAAYAAAKAGLEGLARNIALEYGQYGVRCNVVRPGFVDGARFDARTADSDARREKLIAQTVTGELVTERDVADLVMFLLSDKARAITGAVLDITAGAHLNRLW